MNETKQRATLRTHFFVRKEDYHDLIEEHRNNLVVSPRFESESILPLYIENDECFGFPLYYFSNTSNLVCNDLRNPGFPISVNMSQSFSIRDNQRPVIEKFIETYNNGNTGWLIAMPTGSGKTVCACMMLQILKTTTLIIVPRERLIDQWIERIIQFTDISRDEIGIAQQNICDYEGKKVVVGMIHSLAKNKYSEDFNNYFGLVIWAG